MKYFMIAWGMVMATTAMAHEPIVEVQLDSVSIVVPEINERYIVHQVLPKQTLYTIAKAYNIKVNDLYDANPELRDRLVKKEELIRVPLKGMELIPTISEGPKAYYKVKPKETLFRLARIYFDMDIDHLMRLNNLDGASLEVGQKLLLGTLKIKELNDILAEESEEDLLFLDVEEGQTWTEEKSVGYWLKSADQSTALFVLHNDAPINSLVEVTNPMFDKTVAAKVVGRIPEGAYTGDIDIILSHGLAENLGAIDPRLYVKVKYLH